MIYNLGENNSMISDVIAEIRDVKIQQDRERFRRNVEKVGMYIGFELSKTLAYKEVEVETSLGIAKCNKLVEQPVITSILRAGLPLHNGLLEVFGNADSAFVSAYRKHHKSGDFTIKLEYVTCPDLTDRIVIIVDPMIATGASIVLTMNEMFKYGDPKEIHVVSVISSTQGIEYMQSHASEVRLWTAAIDDELTAKGYIVPGLGDAGDLAYGGKKQV
ncbi:MAG: uracil phosphoribosyltransferase [Chitinophagales bacterium]|nr:uracil phosphoribosyltransferase [Chitinophagales bacterium]